MLLKTHTMADITRVSMLLGMTWGQANEERSRLFSERYGI